jgi:anaerobic selenocysteine-containing dehydrogenase
MANKDCRTSGHFQREDKVEEMRSFCRLCYGRCSLRIKIEGGKVIKVEADPEDPLGRGTICAKGLAWPEILYHPDRLKYPQRRGGKRGEGKWIRISWDEALATIAAKLSGFKKDFGSESVILGLGDPKGLELTFAQRFASAFGTPNIATPGHICHIPGELASTFTFGSPCVLDNEHPARCLIIWGNNFFDTHAGGLTAGQLKNALNKGTRLIVIDPRKTAPASQTNLWLKPRPGSDGMLALGMLKTVVEEDLYDKEFVAEWTTGFDKLREHLKDYSLDRAEEISWVPKEKIKEAARLYAQTKPACVVWGNALDHSINSFQTFRTICILKALTGNLDIPGGEILQGRLPITRPGRFMLLPEFPRRAERMIGGDFKLAARSAFTPRQSAIKAILEGKPYPVKAALLFGTNPLLTYPDAKKTYDALMKLDFLVVSEFFMTPTAELADVVLPAAANFEFDEIAPYPPFAGFILAYPKIVEPPDECWSDAKIINELAKKLGLGEHFWADEREALDLILKPGGLTFEEFKKKRVLKAEKEYERYKKEGFRTPSGKVEVYSQQLKEMGYSPLPIYAESIDLSSPELAQEYPLILTNAKSASFCHSAYRNISSLRQRASEPLVKLNPETAARFGLVEGDEIFIETKEGKIRQRLSLDKDLDPRVIVADYGWWFPERGTGDLYGWAESNINVLTNLEPPYEPAIGSLYLRGFPCRVCRA